MSIKTPINSNGSAAIIVHGVVNEGLFDLFEKRGIKETVILEGRPSLEAARRNAKALAKHNIMPILIADNMAGFFFFKNYVKEVWLAYYVADKEGALCDVGALILAVLAKKHGLAIHLYPAGRKVEFLGKEKDLFQFNGERVAPPNTKAYVPLVEWVDRKYITKIITRRAMKNQGVEVI
jgi:methylthioribose-1-phosphate isomerase